MMSKEQSSGNKTPQLTDEELLQATGGFGRMPSNSCLQYYNKKECEAHDCKWDIGKHGHECMKASTGTIDLNTIDLKK